jgi:phosphatidylinositol alpha-1,6-mannosyltransferase
LTRSALRNAASAIAVSGYTRDLALRVAGSATAIDVIPPGVDLPALKPRVDHRARTVVTVARLTDEYKGHDVVLEAFSRVTAAVDGARWVIVGDGPLRSQLEERAQALGIADVVHFTGRVDDRERDRLLRDAAVFVMPSRLADSGTGGEGFGIAYLEAAAHGVPAVGGCVGGAPDAIVHRETGLLVDPQDEHAVGDAIIELLRDEPLRTRLGVRARQRAEQFSWPVVAGRVEKVLGRVQREQAGT